jgi:hypothetical protein
MTRIAAAKWPLVLLSAAVIAALAILVVVALAFLIRSQHADLRMLR